MDWLHGGQCADIIHRCQCHSRLWWTRVPRRCPPRYTYVPPTYGLHVALRQLAQVEDWLMVLLGWLEHFHHCSWLVPDYCWNIWLYRRHHRFLQGLGWLSCLDLR
jgi:hypothetical protein